MCVGSVYRVRKTWCDLDTGEAGLPLFSRWDYQAGAVSMRLGEEVWACGHHGFG